MGSAALTIERPSLQLILTSLARADLVALVKNPRRPLLSFLLPVLLLLATSSSKATRHLGGALFIIGLSIAYGLLSASSQYLLVLGISLLAGAVYLAIGQALVGGYLLVCAGARIRWFQWEGP